MTREEYGKIKDWDELIAFCDSVGCPLMGDVLSRQEVDDILIADLRKMIINSNTTMDDVRNIVDEFDPEWFGDYFLYFPDRASFRFKEAREEDFILYIYNVQKWAEKNNVFTDDK